MADATAPIRDNRSEGDVQSYPAAAVAIYQGTIVNVNSSGYADVGGDDASETFAGIAAETVDNSGGSAGDKNVRVWKEGVFKLSFGATATQATVGSVAYASDSQTVDLAANLTNDVEVGTVVEFVDASTVRVKI